MILVRFYVWLDQGHALLVQLFPIFYGLPSAGIVLDAFTAAFIGFTLNIGAYNGIISRHPGGHPADSGGSLFHRHEPAPGHVAGDPARRRRIIFCGGPPHLHLLGQDTSLAAAVTCPSCFRRPSPRTV